MQVYYECQICKQIVEDSPPEWCHICGGHRAIFKRLPQTHLEEEHIIIKGG